MGNPLFKQVDEASVLQLPVYQKLLALYDNYDPYVNVAEDHTEQEHQEELDFLQTVLDTDIMRAAYEFLVEKGAFTGTMTLLEPSCMKCGSECTREEASYPAVGLSTRSWAR